MSLEKVYYTSLPNDLRDPDPKKSYGINGLATTFTLKGQKGAVTFSVAWPQYLPHIDYKGKILGMGLGYHSIKPTFHSQEPVDCHIFGTCYPDENPPSAEEWVNIIFTCNDPEPLMWKMLEGYYHEVFGEEE
jgi:hypothetical protein